MRYGDQVEAVLIDAWMRGLDAVPVLDEASLTVVRDRVRAVASEASVPSEVTDRALLVATELGRNHLRHARGGCIAARAIARGEHRGLEVVAADRGPGLVDVAASLDALPRAEGTLGVGIGSVRRLSSEVDFDVRVGEGARSVARLFDRAAPRRREVGVYGRPIAGEKINGDHASFLRIDEALVLGVCDGLGHGPLASEAARAAMKVFAEHAREAPAAILDAAHGELGRTRGVVMAIARVAEDTSMLETASVGNIDVQVCAPRSARRFGGATAVVGGSLRPSAKAQSERVRLGARDLIVLATDGIGPRMSIEGELSLLRQHPIVIAQRVIERFGRANDDALVLVAR